jgi:hypothetical protein
MKNAKNLFIESMNKNPHLCNSSGLQTYSKWWNWQDLTQKASQFQVLTTKILISEYTRSTENPIGTSSALSRKETNQRASQLPHHKSELQRSTNAQKFVKQQHKTYLTLEWHRCKHTIKCTLPVCCHKHKIVPCLIRISHLPKKKPNSSHSSNNAEFSNLLWLQKNIPGPSLRKMADALWQW